MLSNYDLCLDTFPKKITELFNSLPDKGNYIVNTFREPRSDVYRVVMYTPDSIERLAVDCYLYSSSPSEEINENLNFMIDTLRNSEIEGSQEL